MLLKYYKLVYTIKVHKKASFTVIVYLHGVYYSFARDEFSLSLTHVFITCGNIFGLLIEEEII